MSTLISAHNSDGCIGRCDAKCHNATKPDCDCICGGVNHGVGEKQAMINTIELTAEKIKEYCGDQKAEIFKKQIQGTLF